MSQISPPVRILFVAAIAFAAVYMLFLKPDTGTSDAATAAATAAPAATVAAATTTKAATSTAKSAAASVDADAVKASKLPAAVKHSIAGNDVVVLLFWNARAADDQAVHRELSHLPKRPGKVLVRSVPVKKVSAYQGIARGVDLSQSPTTVVVDRDLAATALVGYVDHTTIDQAIRDALR